MNQTNKIIKYLAIAFGLFLVFNIILGIMFGFVSIGNIFQEDEPIELKQLEIKQNIEILEIDVNSVNIIIKESDSFKVETNNKYVNYKQNDNKVSITQKRHSWFKDNSTDLIIYLPVTMLEEVTIKTGAGKVEIERLSTKRLNLDLGAGKVNINYLEVEKKAQIDGGAGEIKILDGNIYNLDLDMGVGKLNLKAFLKGKSDIESGVGELNLTLNGKEEIYEIKGNKGIGSFKISGEEITNDKIYGNGINRINIDGGIGSINVEFSDDLYFENNVVKSYTRTYNLLNITQGQEENSYYLTLQVFQGEVDTVLVKDLNKTLEVGKNYEFDFERNYVGDIESSIESIFSNSKINSINETEKNGLDQIQDNIN